MVKVYSMTTCPWCVKAKAYLDSRGVAYETLNIDTDEEARRACLALSGDLMAPVITADDKNFVLGFDKAKIDALLGL